MNCIVISHPEFQQLAKDTGIPIYELDYLVSKWQDKNNTLNRFPSKDELREGVNFSFKTTKIVSNNLDRMESLWKQLKDTDVFWNKIQKDFGIPKEQLALFKESEGNTIKDKLIDFISKYSYAIQVKTATQETDDRGVYAQPHFTLENGDEYVKWGENDYEFFPKGDRSSSKPITKEEYEKAKPENQTPTQHYSNLTVPGGTNYTENEISTPGIIPSIKGHAQFSTDNGIGWFRSDEKVNGGEFNTNMNNPLRGWDTIEGEKGFAKTEGGNPTKTRRILEVQSDLFQKGRGRSDVAKVTEEQQETFRKIRDEKSFEEATKYLNSIKENQFLQLLNKDNNWVTFFVKSIIQDSAKKGYEKVLFPSGNTASKVEGHATLEEFKKQKEDRIKELERRLENKKDELSTSKNLLESDKRILQREIEKIPTEINQLKQELERVETEGFGALKPIYNFYETTVKNILKKNYQVNQVTDEYGNTWNEITLSNKEGQNILFQLKNSPNLGPSIKELDKYLLNFLKDFGVRSKEFTELKSKLGVDALGATDVLNKLIWYVKDRNAETVPEEVGHMIVMLMGETNPLIAELLSSITNWSEFANVSAEYTPIYRNEKQVRIEAIGKLIAKALVKNYKAVGVDKNLIERLLDSIKKILEDILKTFNFGQAMFSNEHIADKIALNILAGNKNFVANLNTINPRVDYEKALKANPFAKAIINTFTSAKYKAKLTGSLAIAGQNEHIYRPGDAPIHDIDFTVNSLEDYNKILETLKELKAEPVHFGWSNAQKDYDTYAWYIPAPGFKINILKRDFQRGNGWVEQYELFDRDNKRVEPTQDNVAVIDFFVSKDNKKNSDSIFTNVNDIYFGKLTLSPLGNNERFFLREKDQQDYVLHKPTQVSSNKSEFTYYQLALREKGITKEEFNSLTAEEKEHLIHQLFNC